MTSTYSQAREELAEGLSQDIDALGRLHQIYKLPKCFSSLKPERTVHALEMIGVFSPEHPTALVELPSLLGMTECHKKIKKILKIKKQNSFRFKGCNDLHESIDMQRFLGEVQYSGRIFLANLDLLKVVLETRANNNPDLIRNIESISELRVEVKNAIFKITETGNEVLCTKKASNDDFTTFYHSQTSKPSSPSHDEVYKNRPLPLVPGSDPAKRKVRVVFDNHEEAGAKERPLPLLPGMNNGSPIRLVPGAMKKRVVDTYHSTCLLQVKDEPSISKSKSSEALDSKKSSVIEKELRRFEESQKFTKDSASRQHHYFKQSPQVNEKSELRKFEHSQKFKKQPLLPKPAASKDRDESSPLTQQFKKEFLPYYDDVVLTPIKSNESSEKPHKVAVIINNTQPPFLDTTSSSSTTHGKERINTSNFSTQQNDTQSKGLEKRKVALLPPNKKITYPASSTARSSDCRPDSYVDMTIGPDGKVSKTDNVTYVNVNVNVSKATNFDSFSSDSDANDDFDQSSLVQEEYGFSYHQY